MGNQIIHSNSLLDNSLEFKTTRIFDFSSISDERDLKFSVLILPSCAKHFLQMTSSKTVIFYFFRRCFRRVCMWFPVSFKAVGVTVVRIMVLNVAVSARLLPVLDLSANFSWPLYLIPILCLMRVVFTSVQGSVLKYRCVTGRCNSPPLSCPKQGVQKSLRKPGKQRSEGGYLNLERQKPRK